MVELTARPSHLLLPTNPLRRTNPLRPHSLRPHSQLQLLTTYLQHVEVVELLEVVELTLTLTLTPTPTPTLNANPNPNPNPNSKR